MTKIHYNVKMNKLWFIKHCAKIRYTIFSILISCRICSPAQPVCPSWKFCQTQKFDPQNIVLMTILTESDLEGLFWGLVNYIADTLYLQNV